MRERMDVPRPNLRQRGSLKRISAQSAAGGNLFAGHETSIVRREERDDARNVVRLARTAKRRLRNDAGLHWRANDPRCLGSLGYHEARADHIYPNVARSEFLDENARDRVHGRLRRGACGIPSGMGGRVEHAMGAATQSDLAVG